ncbi:MAG: BON domain-containing protein [Candidatus Saccharibacteria bacterium]|nr:BON domain-containing protein [Moraxellaceae bacterium]
MKSDLQLQLDVLAELTWDPSVDARHIGVSVDSGIVSLSGNFDNLAAKWNSERAAKHVTGVKALTVEINVKLPSSSKKTDTEIAKSVENTLEWTINVPKKPFKIMVEDGWVTLSGEAKWDYQRNAGTDAIRSLIGIVGITNQIKLVSKDDLIALSTVIKIDIETALKRLVTLDSHKINIETTGSEVILSGTVKNLLEADMAKHAAWAALGVTSVINHIVLP